MNTTGRFIRYGGPQQRGTTARIAMSARAKLSVSVEQVQRHIEFLKRVHDDALNRESGLYRDRSILGEAVTRSVVESCALRRPWDSLWRRTHAQKTWRDM